MIDQQQGHQTTLMGLFTADPANVAQAEGHLAEQEVTLASGTQDCTVNNVGLPSAGGGWAAGRDEPVKAVVLVLAFLALGVSLLTGHTWSLRWRGKLRR